MGISKWRRVADRVARMDRAEFRDRLRQELGKRLLVGRKHRLTGKQSQIRLISLRGFELVVRQKAFHFGEKSSCPWCDGCSLPS